MVAIPINDHIMNNRLTFAPGAELGRQIHVFLSSVTLADVVEKRILGRTKPCELKQDEKADATAQAA